MASPIDILTADPAVQDEHAPRTGDTQARLAAVLADLLGVDQVPVDSDFFQDLGADSMVMARFCARLRKRADLPSVSIKDVYQHPTVAALAAALAPAGASAPAPVETALAEVLAEVLGVDRVAVDSHFFDDLGADSMVMARFCARLRKRADLPSVSIKDVYAHPTVTALATAFAETAAAPTATAPQTSSVTEAPAPGSTAAYVLTGALQLLIITGYAYILAMGFSLTFDWISAGGSPIDSYLRAMLAGSGAFIGACLLPVAVKWTLIGRWKRQEIPVWTLAYLRFWVVKTATTLNPMVLFAGSPVYNLYLRALGAKIGRNVVILTRHAPVCADLITIGDGAVIRNHTYFTGYRARAGVIQTGTVTLGRNAFVGEKSVLDIDVSIGDGAQLGHASSLHAGQAVPAGQRWHGSPGEPTESNYQTVEPAEVSTRRMISYTVLQMALWFLFYVPVTTGGLAILLEEVPWLNALLEPGSMALSGGNFFVVAVVVSLALFFGGILLSLLVAGTVPRLLYRFLEPDTVYPMYGFRYSAHRAITRLTNRRFFVELFGDSSYVVPYLHWLGYKLKPVVQTGSNYASELVHENPFLCETGKNTVVASGLHFVNADYSNSSFRLSRARIGANNFLGNDIIYPPQSRTGDNCLLATKVLVPIDGPVRENVGLLGSPAFEIPRTVDRDSRFIRMAHDEEFPRRLAAKNRHNLATMAYWLLAKWVYSFALTLIGLLAADLYADLHAASVALAELAIVLFTLFYVTLVERLATGFRGLEPRHCSIYEKGFWQSERFFKLQAGPGLNAVFIGTPFQSWFWRLVGVRLGKRLFDDGGGMSEKTLVTLGDDVTINVGSFIQCHSQEDYAFKSDRVEIGSGATIGIGTTVHYGVTIGDGAVIAPESFLMKGEEVPACEHWGGNPAREMPETLRPATPAQLETPRFAEEPQLLPAPRPAGDDSALEDSALEDAALDDSDALVGIK